MIAVLRILAPLAVILALASAPDSLRGQVAPPPGDTLPGAPSVPAATPAVVDTAARDTADPISPKSAFFHSLILPGWGQSKLGAPVRGGVYFALEAGSLWNLYRADRKLSEARRLQRFYAETGRPDMGNALVRERRNEREDWITLSVFFLFFSGADAFVAAHLRDFDTRVDAFPAPDGGVQLQTSIPVGP